MAELKIIPYTSLIQEYQEDYIPYSKLLLTEEWRAKRAFIIDRDNQKCQECNKHATDTLIDKNNKQHDVWLESIKDSDMSGLSDLEVNDMITNEYRGGFKIVLAKDPYYLHVHHKYYIISNLPWDYPNESLITLCNWCHSKFHENSTVSIYLQKNGDLIEMYYTPCYRCYGAGILPEYKHVQKGICFRCKGSKYEELFSNSVNNKKESIEDDLPF